MRFAADEQVRAAVEKYVVELGTRVNTVCPQLESVVKKLDNLDADVALTNETHQEVFASQTKVADLVKKFEKRLDSVEKRVCAIECKIGEYVVKLKEAIGASNKSSQSYYQHSKRTREQIIAFEQQM